MHIRFRGHNIKNPGVFLLSPWEFLMHWECVRLPRPSGRDNALSIWLEGPRPDDPNDEIRSYGPNPRAETTHVLFYPELFGDMQLRNKWYMRRRPVLQVPAPSSTPMPDKANDSEGKARLFSIYLRPWTLDQRCCSDEVPLIVDLDKAGEFFFNMRHVLDIQSCSVDMRLIICVAAVCSWSLCSVRRRDGR